jgi:hypothetical protein
MGNGGGDGDGYSDGDGDVMCNVRCAIRVVAPIVFSSYALVHNYAENTCRTKGFIVFGRVRSIPFHLGSTAMIMHGC